MILYYSKYLFPKFQILSNTSNQNHIEYYHRVMHLSLKGKEERERMCNLRKANDSKLPDHFIQHKNIVTVSVSVVFHIVFYYCITVLVKLNRRFVF